MNEVEEIKRRKLEALQRQLQERSENNSEDEQQAQQQIAALEAAVKTRLSKEALLRYGNLKSAHPEKAIQLLVVLAKLMQNGRMETVSDQDMKSILMKLSDPKKGTMIIRK